MRVLTSLFFLLFTNSILFSAQITTAKAAATEAAKKSDLSKSVAYLKQTVASFTDTREKRALCAFLASVQEQMGQYEDAEKSYAQAAAMVAGDAAGMPKKSSEQLVLDATRCALCCGNYANAESYLSSEVQNTADETTKAYLKLYRQWARLCKAESDTDTKAAVATLNTYVDNPSMTAVEPTVLLTLWHVTGSKSYSDKLKKKYPKSLETAIVKGDIQQLPAPFWYFVHRVGDAVAEVKQTAITETKSAAASSEKAKKQQLGLFKDESNAKVLVEKAKSKGFNAYIAPDVRPSGTKYYLVVVDENKSGSMGQKLRDAGFECYPFFD